ncbi:MAG: aldolase/citrate lyase family protein, partial [Ilumatobacteraceae bacterium]
IESAAGVLDAPAVARLGHVRRLSMGDADLAADLGMHLSPDRREMDAVRAAVVVASAAAGIDAPCGPVATDLSDDDGLRESTLELRRRGFGARTAIHPNQLATINECFTPSPDDVAEARSVVDAFEQATARGDGGVVLDGEYVDAAVARRARLVLGPD